MGQDQMPSLDDLTRAVAAGVAAPVDEELWERRMKALTLRNAGGTFNQIAFQLGISATVARADVRLALREVLSETTEDFVARQRSVLLDCQRGAYPGALQGDKDSIMAIVRCLEQEAKLLGLYAPARVAVGINNVDFAEQAADLIAKLGLTPPRELMTHGRQDALGAGLAFDRSGASAAADDLARRHGQPLDVGEVVDGLIERFSPAAGFDIPAFALPVDADPLEAAISDAAIGDAAAAAIDPDRFGDQHSGNSDDHGEGNSGAAWSNL